MRLDQKHPSILSSSQTVSKDFIALFVRSPLHFLRKCSSEHCRGTTTAKQWAVTFCTILTCHLVQRGRKTKKYLEMFAWWKTQNGTGNSLSHGPARYWAVTFSRDKCGVPKELACLA